MADYIKREDAINAALEQLPVCLEIDAVESALMELPAADVRPVIHAYWKSAPHKKSRFCSHCYYDEPYKFADEDANIFNFCPNCGADMRETCDSDSCPIHFPDEQQKYDPDEFFSAERSGK